jgi:hypothetical protein
VSDYHPELDGYEPGNGRPLRPAWTIWVMRGVVVLALVALVVPGMITTVTVASTTASRACAQWVAYAVDGPSGSDARFELFGPGGLGWECYSSGAFGHDRHVASLGLIPSQARLPTGPSVDS